jgi:tripartite-type tricarboxylate transporter receptor subunit TctC
MHVVLPGLLAIAVATPAAAQSKYPSRPIRMIVPFPAGGTADIAARIIAQPLAQAVGENVIVDNRAGADGIIAADLTLKATPDGYTVFFGTNGAMSAVPTLRKKPPYDPVRDFTPITMIGRFTFFLFVHPSVPARSMTELLDHVRANPGKLNYGSGNTTAIVASAQMKSLQKLDVLHIPYKGDAPTTADLLGGRIHYAFMAPIPALGQAREGKLRMLATLLPTRSPLAPDVPTLAEAGVPGISVGPWAGLFGPARLPKEVVDRLARDFGTVLNRPDVRDQLGRQGFEARSSTPAELATHVREQIDVWARVIREAGIPIE